MPLISFPPLFVPVSSRFSPLFISASSLCLSSSHFQLVSNPLALHSSSSPHRLPDHLFLLALLLFLSIPFLSPPPPPLLSCSSPFLPFLLILPLPSFPIPLLPHLPLLPAITRRFISSAYAYRLTLVVVLLGI